MHLAALKPVAFHKNASLNVYEYIRLHYVQTSDVVYQKLHNYFGARMHHSLFVSSE